MNPHTNLTIEDIYLLRDIFVRKYLGIKFYPYQKEISNIMIRELLFRTGNEIPVEVSRQAGKTEAIVCTVVFLMAFAQALTKRFWGEEKPIRTIIFAPQKEQAKTDFDRLKTYLGILARSPRWGNVVDTKESNQTTLQLVNGSSCYIFALTPTSHPESKSADLLIYEEAHKIIDAEKKNKAEPMGASTNAPEISVGVSWYNKNYFKRLIDSQPDHPRYPAPLVVEQRQKAYERDGNTNHLLYKLKWDKILERDGPEDPAVKTQWLLQWHLEAGEFMSALDWDEMCKPYEYYVGTEKKLWTPKLMDKDLASECYAGIDTAKHPDSTVVTILRWNKESKWKELVALLELHGTNYADQFTIITGYDTVQGKWTGEGMFEAFNIVGVAIDSTGQGSFMPDMFSTHTKWKEEKSGLFPVKFSLQSKDIIGTNLEQVVKNRLTAIPNEDTLELKRMRQQMLDLEKEYKGQFLSFHHPEDDKGQEYHDDYPDSWALAEYAFTMQNRIVKPKIRGLG